MRVSVTVVVVGSILATSAFADECADKVRRQVDDVCGAGPPLLGTKEETKVSAEAGAGFSGVVRWVFSGEARGGVAHTEETYRNYARKDLQNPKQTYTRLPPRTVCVFV